MDSAATKATVRTDKRFIGKTVRIYNRGFGQGNGPSTSRRVWEAGHLKQAHNLPKPSSTLGHATNQVLVVAALVGFGLLAVILAFGMAGALAVQHNALAALLALGSSASLTLCVVAAVWMAKE